MRKILPGLKVGNKGLIAIRDSSRFVKIVSLTLLHQAYQFSGTTMKIPRFSDFFSRRSACPVYAPRNILLALALAFCVYIMTSAYLKNHTYTSSLADTEGVSSEKINSATRGMFNSFLL